MGHNPQAPVRFKKKKNQVKSLNPESRVPETGSDPPIGSGRDSGRDICSDSSHKIFSLHSKHLKLTSLFTSKHNNYHFY